MWIFEKEDYNNITHLYKVSEAKIFKNLIHKKIL